MRRKKSSGKLELKLLGSPEVWLDGQAVTGFRSGKARALLYYLAVTGRAQPRSVLAGLFWGGVAEHHARRSLTMTLSNLRQLIGSHLDIDRETVAFDANSPTWLDVAVFEAGVTAAPQGQAIDELKQAIALYRGDFLAGFYLHDAPEFEQWLLVERTRLRERVLQALHRLADHLAARADLPQAIETMRRLLALEPWREEAHRYLMLLLARDGQRSAALAQFEICRQMLAAELDVEPGTETITLYEQIRAGELSGGDLTSSPLPLHSPAPLHNLPPQSTPFVGRERERAEIIRRLTDRHCRLLTLVGPGGIGKTRLALEVAQTLSHSVPAEGFFGHGIYFTPLAAVSSTNGVVLALAEGIGLSFHGNASPKQQLLDTQGNVQRAQPQLHQALQLAAEIQFVPLMVSILKAIGELWLKSNRPKYGLKVLAFVRQHPASDQATQAEAQQLLDRCSAEAGKAKADLLAAAQAYAGSRTLPEVVAEVLAEAA
jgi:DNA-binding SARP family transcriptional activator